MGNWLTLTLGVMIFPIWAIIGWLISATAANVVGLVLMVVNITIIVIMLRKPPTAQYPQNIWWAHLALTVAPLVCLPAGTFLLTSTYGAMSGVSRFLAELFYGTFIKPFPLPTYTNRGWALDPGAYKALMDLLLIGAISIAMVLQTAQCLEMTTNIPKGKIQWWKKALWVGFLPILGFILANIGRIFIFGMTNVMQAVAGSLPADFGGFDWVRTIIAAIFSLAIVVAIGFMLLKSSLRDAVTKHIILVVLGSIAVYLATQLQLQSAATSIAPIANAQFGIPIERVQALQNAEKTLLGEISAFVGNERFVCVQANAETVFLPDKTLKELVQINSGQPGLCEKSATKPGYNTQTNLFYLFFVTGASFVATFFLGDKLFWVLPRAAAKVADNLGTKAPANQQVDAVALFQGVFVYIILCVLISELLFAYDTVSSVFGEALTSGLVAPPKTKEWTELFALLLSEKDGKLLLGGLFAKWGFFVPALCSMILPFLLAGVIRIDVENEYGAKQPAAQAAKPVAPADKPAAQAAKPVAPADKPAAQAANPAAQAAQSAAEAAQSAAKAAQSAAQAAKPDKDLFGTGGFF